MTLRDALAAALERSGLWRVVQPGFLDDLPELILSDPAFRAALTEAIADGFMWNMDVDPCEHCTWSTDDSANEVAAAIVAQMIEGSDAMTDLDAIEGADHE